MKTAVRNTAGMLIMLLLILTLMLTGCGNAAKKAAGTYRATYNMRDQLNKELAAAGMTLSSDVNADFILELREDGTFSFDIDGAGFSSSFAEIIRSEGKTIIDSMLKEQGVTEDMYDLFASTSGFESYDAFVEGMIAMIEDEMGDKFVKKLETAAHVDGTFTVEKKRLVIKSGSEGGMSMDEGTINEDGSIALTSALEDGTTMDLLFVKQ